MLTLVIGSIFVLASAFADPSPLDSVHRELYGEDLFHPSRVSLLGQYLSETSAQTVIRSFPNAPLTTDPSYQLGPLKLVVAVSPETFGAFRKYFISRHFFYAISLVQSDHIQIALEGKSALYSPPFKDTLGFTAAGMMMVPILLDDNESARASTFFSLVTKFSSNWNNHNGFALYPQNIATLSGKAFFPRWPTWSGCASWFGNIPIGNKLVDTYYFPSGNELNPIAQQLEEYSVPSLSREDHLFLEQVYSIPGHQQLGEVLAPRSLRRGDFTNGGWIIYTLLGAIGTDRTPLVFLQVNDEKVPISPDFPLQIIAR